jgi:hypothetical protein
MERDGEGWRGMERDGEGWRGMERDGEEWRRMDRNGQGWTGMDREEETEAKDAAVASSIAMLALKAKIHKWNAI